MAKKEDKQDEAQVYIIPPNFIEIGTLFGGMLKLRNVFEAIILVVIIGYPLFHMSISITTKIVIACLTVLPVGILALIGIAGQSLSAFIFNFFKFLQNRRVVGVLKNELVDDGKIIFKQNKIKKAYRKSKNLSEESNSSILVKHGKFKLNSFIKTTNQVAQYIPITDIKNGVVYTKDGRFLKVIEVIPINFLLRSNREQKSIVYSFISYLKVCPVKMQFKVLNRRADINNHLNNVRNRIKNEKNDRCRALQEDYINLVKQVGSKEAITRRFFIIFEYEPFGGRNKSNEAEAIAELQTAARTAKTYLSQCGNDVITFENDKEADNEFITELFYSILNRRTSINKPLPEKVKEVISQYRSNGWENDIPDILVTEFIVPKNIDLSHARYVKMDGVYYSYMMIPSNGYKSQVLASWTSLIVNAGEGIDMDLFLNKQPKDRIQQKLGQQLRINRSRIKETSDTNSDFDDLEGAIKGGYYIKNCLSNNEDFYYMNIIVTVTGASVDELEWRVNEMKKLMLSQDLDIFDCSFSMEQAFLSTLPLVSLDKNLYVRSKRNVLTLGAASCYPFSSFEMSDDAGILLGVNKHNNSLIIVDIFNSKIYKNANMAILGTSGAGKTFTLQLMALRMRMKNIQVFIISPLKGHECAPRFVVNSIW